ncbi:MAG: phospho-sugar mutase [Clostridiales bacterium]|jgi:phosphoglucomutase|nr:phospho-sugar mutase [Clostridiales bacterium]
MADADYRAIYREWLENAYFDEQTRLELRGLPENEIEERFYKNLDFGTGGLRGIIGAGTNRMNIYTVRKATQGLANYILKNAPPEKGAAIAYDSRRFSKEFAEAAALVLCANGVKVYLFEGLRPTPELSFAVRRLRCAAGIVVTASHNPPEYNGYKVYWDDGGQVQSPRDLEIIAEVDAIGDYSIIKLIDREQAIETGLLKMIGKEIDDAFMECVLAQSRNPGLIKEMNDKFSIVYTPFNGAGSVPVQHALKQAGFTRVHTVPEQERPDPDFTTIGYPNPESPDAWRLAVKLLKETGADIAIATDPDSDRVGAVQLKNGEPVYYSGNTLGVLLTEYVLSSMKAAGTLPSNPAVVTTVVSTNMTAAVCKAYGADCFEVLTGFKYIGGLMSKLENSGSHTVIMGFEESIGYLIGSHARDKDAVTASLLICEMAASYKSRGMDLEDAMDELFAKYGCFKEASKSFAYPGLEGIARMKEIMAGLRANPPQAINGVNIIERRDYKTGVVDKMGVKTSTGLPESDVLYYVLEDESWFCVRPSGTEPKIKMYCGVRKAGEPDADSAIKALAAGVNGLLA